MSCFQKRASVDDGEGPKGPVGRRPSMLGTRRASISFRALSISRRMSVASSSTLSEYRRQQNLRKQSRPTLKFENTYKLEADEGETFECHKAEKVAQDLMEKYLTGIKYDQTECSLLSLKVSEYIKDAVKALGTPRFKIICNVVISEKGRQAISVVSRCLWNDHTDDFAVAKYENASIAAIATIHAIYYE